MAILLTLQKQLAAEAEAADMLRLCTVQCCKLVHIHAQCTICKLILLSRVHTPCSDEIPACCNLHLHLQSPKQKLRPVPLCTHSLPIIGVFWMRCQCFRPLLTIDMLHVECVHQVGCPACHDCVHQLQQNAKQHACLGHGIGQGQYDLSNLSKRSSVDGQQADQRRLSTCGSVCLT